LVPIIRHAQKNTPVAELTRTRAVTFLFFLQNETNHSQPLPAAIFSHAVASRSRSTTKHLDATAHDAQPLAMASTTPREGVNPLRPYYILPTIGEQAESRLPGQPNPFSRATNATAAAAAPGSRYASRARDIFPDLDYRDYVNDPSPSTVQGIRDLVDELLWKYTSVLMAQPFEVAKTILQARAQDDMALLETGFAQETSKPKVTSAPQPIFDDEVRTTRALRCPFSNDPICSSLCYPWHYLGPHDPS
jgi:hypothetical protein